MEWLDFSHNELTGEIPSELGNLSNLEELYLSHNELTGEIPSELGKLSNLEELYLGGNELIGCVPEGLSYARDNDFVASELAFCGGSRV